MKFSTKQIPFSPKFCFFILLLFCWIAISDAVSCDSCGRECASACGTKHFRTCCFNYLRKRSAPISGEIEIFTSPYASNSNDNNINGIDFISIEQKLENWLKNTHEMENAIRKAIDVDRTMQQINKKKKLNDDNAMEF